MCATRRPCSTEHRHRASTAVARHTENVDSDTRLDLAASAPSNRLRTARLYCARAFHTSSAREASESSLREIQGCFVVIS